jgi:hypothetical protein
LIGLGSSADEGRDECNATKAEDHPPRPPGAWIGLTGHPVLSADVGRAPIGLARAEGQF